MSWTHLREDWTATRDLVLRGDASEWLRDALCSALAQDPRERASDAELLVAVLLGRCEDLDVCEPDAALASVAASARDRRWSCLGAKLRRGEAARREGVDRHAGT